VGVLLLMAAFSVLGVALREPVTRAAEVWVNVTGLGGMFLAIGVLDSVPSPIPPDIFTGFAYVGGLDFWAIAAVASLASVSGGTAAWAVARRFSETDWFKRFIHGRGAQPYALVKRYGTVALVLGAVSPLPFSLTCYAAGTLKMPYPRFFAVAMLRAPRILFYLALIRLGWVGVA
jgi:membrane protein YqaA with SNARE-associated domain